MTEASAKRTTWNLGEEIHPATFPAEQLDPDAAVAAALALKTGYDRYDDATTVLGAALDHAAECMRDALAELAFQARDAGPEAFQEASTGWRSFWEPGPSPSNIDLMIVHPTEPGAWHVSVRFTPVLTEAAAFREAEIEAVIEAANPDWSPIDRILASLNPKGDDPDAKELKRLRNDPGSYRPAARGDKLQVVYGTALDLGAKGWRGIGSGGKPRSVEEFDHARKFLPVKAYAETWWRGIQLSLRPVQSYAHHEGMLVPGRNESGACPEIPLMILGDLIRSTGLAPLVAQRAEKTGALPWISYKL